MEPLEILFAGVVGIFSGSLVLLGLYLLQFKFPKLFSLNPFHFLGSLVFTDSSGIYLLGSLTCWMVSGILGIVYGYAYSFEESLIRTTIPLIVIQYVLFGLLIVLLGSSIMFIYDFSIDNNLTLGNILAILCSVCFAFVFIISDQVNKTENSFSFSKNVFIYAGLTLFLIAILTNVNFLNISIYDFMFLFILGVVPTIIGHSVLYYLVKYLQPTVVASIPLGEPFIASIFAWVLFPGQILNIYIILGGITTLFGLFIIIQNKK